MKKSLHIYIASAVFIIGLILGSFFDLQINEALFHDRNAFSIIVAAFGTIPGYGLLALLSGYLFMSEMKYKHENIFLRIFIFLVCLASIALPIYYQGKEMFSFNAFNNEKLNWLGYLISVFLMGGLAYLGGCFGNKYSSKESFKLIVIAALICGLSILSVTVIKHIFDRPRYRIAVAVHGDTFFYNWWEIYKEEKFLSKGEFTSFPSGHTCGAAMTMVLLPIICLLIPKFNKYQVASFYIGLGWTILVAFSRLLAGAHYLSDVSMGALIVTIFNLIGYYLIKEYVFKKETVIKEEE